MAESYLELKKARKTDKSAMEKLKAALDSENQYQTDERIWKPVVDKAGRGEYLLRWLPGKEKNGLPFVKYFDYGFKGPGGWYIERSLESIGKPDPVKEMNSALFGTPKGKAYWKDMGDPEGKSGRTAPRTHYVANIWMINDFSNPANNNKVHLFDFGNQIMDILREAMNPQFASKKAFNPFDLWEGATFLLRAAVDPSNKQRTYKLSDWKEPGPLTENDEELKKIFESQFSLNDFTDEAKYKSYAELKAKLDRVLTGQISTITAEQEMQVEPRASIAPVAEEKVTTPPWVAASEEDSDSMLAELQSLVDDK